MVYVCLLICVQSDIDGPDDSDVLPLQANAMSFNVCNRDLCLMFQKQARRTTASTTEEHLTLRLNTSMVLAVKLLAVPLSKLESHPDCGMC